MKRRVVISGIGCVSPAGNDARSTWESLLAGRSAVEGLPWAAKENCLCAIGAPIRDFHPENLKVRQDVSRMGKSGQFALAAAVEAWHDAKLDSASADPTRCGVIIGTGIGDAFETYVQTKGYLRNGVRSVHPLYVPRVMPNASSGIVSIELGLTGPVFTTASACASSAHAVAVALRLIQSGDADLFLTGGTEESFSCIIPIAGFDAIRALSRRNAEPAKASRPFDRNRDGFILGEGAGIVVLEELEHALRRGAPIYAELAGAGMTGDAHHISAPQPSGEGAFRAMSAAMAEAGWGPGDVDYINAHGTSTVLNDKIETKAIRRLLGERANSVKVSATKSMIGHLIGASTAVGLIATALSISTGRVHPTINLDTPDPDCDLDYVPHKAIACEVRGALVNAFGFGGHCASLAVGRCAQAPMAALS